MYRYSKYNLLLENKKKELLVANLLSNRQIKICKEKRKNIKFCNLLDDNISSKDFKILQDGGFIVKKEINEMQLADEKYNKIFCDNKLLHITIVPTDACNFNCLYCYEEERDNIRMSNEVQQSILKYIENNVSNYKQLRIDWFGGEPLLMKEMIYNFMIQVNLICKANRIPLFSDMTTNGYELDLSTFKKLYDCKITHFQISLDGTETTHNKYRPHKVNGDSFQVIFKNLNDILQNVNGMYCIVLRVNLTQEILEHIDEFLEKISVFKNNRHLFINWQLVNDYGGNQVHKIEDTMLSDYSICRQLMKRCNELGINIHTKLHLSVTETICEVPKKNFFTIDYLGRITKCSLADYDKVNKDNNLIGMLTSDGIINFDKEKVQKWSSRLSLKDECYDCIYYPLCFNVICPFRRKFKASSPCFPSKALLAQIILDRDENSKIPIL